MGKTKLEKEISRRRKRKGILVPLLEDLFMTPVEIETDEDVDWIEQLLRRMVQRGHDRNHRPLYSPSQLSACLRHVYLLKHRKQHGIPFHRTTSTSTHYIFFNGNFLHIKWQFALRKLEQAIDDPSIFQLHGVEVPIISKHKDHGGTVDGLVSIYEKPTIVDFKGINVRTFQEITRGFVPATYTLQLSDYGMLFNAATKNGDPKISTALLVSENKGGADPKRPLALEETEIQIETHLPEVRSRLKELRKYAEKEEIPPPECVSTKSFQFKGCAFRKFCKEEVKEYEQRARLAAREDAKRLAVAIPERRRRNRSRRNSK